MRFYLMSENKTMMSVIATYEVYNIKTYCLWLMQIHSLDKIDKVMAYSDSGVFLDCIKAQIEGINWIKEGF